MHYTQDSTEKLNQVSAIHNAIVLLQKTMDELLGYNPPCSGKCLNIERAINTLQKLNKFEVGKLPE